MCWQEVSGLNSQERIYGAASAAAAASVRKAVQSQGMEDGDGDTPRRCGPCFDNIIILACIPCRNSSCFALRLCRHAQGCRA